MTPSSVPSTGPRVTVLVRPGRDRKLQSGLQPGIEEQRYPFGLNTGSLLPSGTCSSVATSIEDEVVEVAEVADGDPGNQPQGRRPPTSL